LDEELSMGTFSWSNWSKDKITAKKSSAPRDSILFTELCQAIEARFDAYYPDKPKTGAGIYTAKYKPTISLFSKFYGAADLEAICQVIKDIESPSSRENFGSIVSVTLDHMGLKWDKQPLFEARRATQFLSSLSGTFLVMRNCCRSGAASKIHAGNGCMA